MIELTAKQSNLTGNTITVNCDNYDPIDLADLDVLPDEWEDFDPADPVNIICDVLLVSCHLTAWLIKLGFQEIRITESTDTYIAWTDKTNGQKVN